MQSPPDVPVVRRAQRTRPRAAAVTGFIMFGFVGAIATATHFACLALLVEGRLLDPVPASCLGAAAGAVVSYCLNYRFTFRSSQQHRVAIPRFVITAAIAFALNGAILAAIMWASTLHYLAAQALTTLAVMTVTYATARWWIFPSSHD